MSYAPLTDMTSDQEIMQLIGTDDMFMDIFAATLEEASDEQIFTQVKCRHCPCLPLFFKMRLCTPINAYVCLLA